MRNWGRIVERIAGASRVLPIDQRIPRPEINYNQVETDDEVTYIREFKENACLRELPFLMRNGLVPESTLLDYGCGLGRLAYAASNYLSKEGAYYGYEPNPSALMFLKTAYREYENFLFHGVPLLANQDYVAIQRHETRIGGISCEAIDLSFIKRPIDLQWSCSVFTHMWQETIVNALRGISAVMNRNSICVNTWLCVDNFAAYVLQCGLADRALPHRINGALTYSLDNPLVCTAYELTTIKEIYAHAGHKIDDIFWGSWCGRDNSVTYQDIIVSRPI